MKELNLQEIQHAELKNFKFLDKLFKQNGFTYYLAYGTLLGAVRHKGFIPWDDDTDIWMPRKDYSAFLAYCKEHEDELKLFKLSTRENTKNYPYGVARFCNQEYKYVTTNSSENAFELGVFTDIYPLRVVL
ncbi:LicD family protein, partial [Lactobacillus helveticus]|uniref:LicD family protein n=1 Tax=Lactobacillus helveticus TaxID=1587 RepID=UPI001566E715